MNGFEKFDKTKLSKNENFYSLLRDEHINDEDCDLVKEV